MCGRSVWTSARQAQQLLQVTATGPDVDTTVIDGRPGNSVMAVVQVPDNRWLLPFRWGFRLNDDRLVYNARVETVSSTPMWKKSWEAGRRAILPLEAFYEGRPGVLFKQLNMDPMMVAGLFTFDEGVSRVTMLTRDAISPVAKVHHRMPVVLPKDLWESWLNKEKLEPELLLKHQPLLYAA